MFNFLIEKLERPVTLMFCAVLAGCDSVEVSVGVVLPDVIYYNANVITGVRGAIFSAN
jgi:hypothetical protein